MARSIVIVPCYNEAQRLDVSSFSDFLEKTGDAVHFLFVDDGSTDHTLEVLAKLRRAYPEAVDFFSLPQNRGKAEAVRQGFLRAQECSADFVGFWDADLATPLEAIADFCHLLEEMPAIDAVFGSRVQLLGRSIERSMVRHYLGRVFATIVSILLGLKVYDTQCGAKLFRALPTTFELFREPFATKWIFDVEIIARMMQAQKKMNSASVADRIYEYPLEQWHHVGDSRLNSGDFLKSIYGIFRIWRKYLR